MKVFLAGATGVIGRQLVPQLLAAGHEVTGMTRSRQRAEQLRATGAQPVVADALDRDALTAAVVEAEPEVVLHMLTAIPARLDPRRIERDFVLNDRLRSEGTRYLVDAAKEAGARRVIAQSIAFVYAPSQPGTLHAESDPLLSPTQAPKSFRRTLQAVLDLEQTVLSADGIVLRFGYFYGPGSGIARDGAIVGDLARRRMPIVGKGTGVWSFVHAYDAAAATVAALDYQDPADAGHPEEPTRRDHSRPIGPAVFNVVDDDPAPVAQWLPALAQAVGSPRPLRVPTFIARALAGSYGVSVMTAAQGASGERAKRELGWQPRYPSWREGFRNGLG